MGAVQLTQVLCSFNLFSYAVDIIPAVGFTFGYEVLGCSESEHRVFAFDSNRDKVSHT